MAGKKKVIKRELPIQKYRIVDCYTLDEDKTPCENCGRPLTNVAIIEGEDGKQYSVGLDCAATLTGINQDDIDYWTNSFTQAKSFRARLKRWCKEIGSSNYYFVVKYLPSGITSIIAYSDDKPNAYVRFDVNDHIKSIEDFIKFCPDLAKKTYINPNIKDLIPEKDYKLFSLMSGEIFDSYRIEYKIELNREKKHVDMRATAIIFNKKEISNNCFEWIKIGDEYERKTYYDDNFKDEKIMNETIENEVSILKRKAAVKAYRYYGSGDRTQWKVLTDVINLTDVIKINNK